MATADQVSSSLRLVFHVGDDEVTHEPILKAKLFNNVKTTATPSALHTVAEALATLQENALYQIERRDQSEINKA